MNKLIICISFIFLLSASCNTPKPKPATQKPTTEVRAAFKKYYDQYKVTGSFVVFDPQENKYIVYNKAQLSEAFTPASTFKICNSLIGLETGVIKDENFVIPWDSVQRQNPKWNSDHDLKTAYKNSTVWYYQELARRVGKEKMTHWLNKVNFGNKDTTGGIDMFWLNGGLRITPYQQIDFLQQLHEEKLPFSKRSMKITKKIMIAEDSLGCVLRAKTGWGLGQNEDIGWYVGYVETKGNVYYFANCIQCSDFNNNDFVPARIETTRSILQDLNIMKK